MSLYNIPEFFFTFLLVFSAGAFRESQPATRREGGSDLTDPDRRREARRRHRSALQSSGLRSGSGGNLAGLNRKSEVRGL